MRCDEHSAPAIQLPATGTCEECGTGTNTMSKKLCEECSEQLGQCEVCRTPVENQKSGDQTG